MTEVSPVASGPASGQIWPGSGATEVAISTDTPVKGQLTLWVDEDAVPSGEGGTGANRMVPVFVFHGESNAGGYAANSEATAAERDPRLMLQILNADQLNWFEPLDIGTNNNVDHFGLDSTTHGWEVGLANSIENGEWWNDKAYLVQTGQGASRVNQWNVGGTYWTKFLQRVRAAKFLIENAGEIPVFYVWQTLGISDAIAGTNANTWLAGMKDIAQRIRAELGHVPIISPTIMASSPGAAYNSHLASWDAEDPLFILFDSTGAATRDNNHWNGAGMKWLASRMVATSKLFGQQEGYILRQTSILGGGQGIAAPTKPSIVCSPSSASFTEGGSATFGVTLSMAPSMNIGVNLVASGADVQVSPPSMIFTPSDWNIPQTATVFSQDDGALNGNRFGTVTCSGTNTASPVVVVVNVMDAGVSGKPGNTTPPTVTGTASVGSTLTCSQGTWTNSPTSYSYRWKRNGTNISNATGSTYVILSGDVGATLACEVTASNTSGSTAADSNGITVVASMSQVSWKESAAGATVDGSGYLTSGTIDSGANAAATPPASTFVAVVDWFSQADANGTVFALDDAASTDFVWSNFTGVSSIHTSNGIAHISTTGTNATAIPGWIPSFPCKVKVEGNGSDVVYSSSTDGVNWSWRYTHAGRLVGRSTVYPRVYFSAPTANQKINVAVQQEVPPSQSPVNTIPPGISGTPSPTQTLVCSNGSWRNSPISFAWQWKRNGADISGAVLNTYAVQAGDAGSTITCAVTAANAVGPSVPVSAPGIYVADRATLVPVTWGSMKQTSSPPGSGEITAVKEGSGGVAAVPGRIDLAAPFDIVVTFPAPGASSDGTVCLIHPDGGANYFWDASQKFIFGIYHIGGSYYAPVDGSNLVPIGGHPAPAYPHRIMMSKVGNDVVYRWGNGADGQFGGVFYRKNGVLAGKSDGWIKMLTFSGGGTITVHYATPTEFQMRPEVY